MLACMTAVRHNMAQSQLILQRNVCAQGFKIIILIDQTIELVSEFVPRSNIFPRNRFRYVVVQKFASNSYNFKIYFSSYA